MIPRPDRNQHVFFRALDDLGSLIDDRAGEEMTEIKQGDQWAARYNMIREPLLEGKVELL